MPSRSRKNHDFDRLGFYITCALSIAEVACAFHRHVQDGTLKGKAATQVRDAFLELWGTKPGFWCR
jgi:hypothetical protein